MRRLSRQLRRLARSNRLERDRARLREQFDSYLVGWPPGHFYSPIPSLPEVRNYEARLFGPPPATLAGVDLNLNAQEFHFRQIEHLYPEQPFSDHAGLDHRFGFDNPNFSYGEAITLYGMMRALKPRRIIEIGSGYSSCAILYINELFFDNSVSCLFVEPHPELFLSLITPAALRRVRLLKMRVQDVSFQEFEELEPGDFLFVDSSRVSKVGSDVNHLVFDVFPRLKRGVYIHIHDIVYPFECRKEWIYQGRAWNEAYILRAFLQYNAAFTIEFFNSYWAQCRREELITAMPLYAKCEGSSLWLQKRA
jgi:hypothetical protein